jgi:Double-stranded RNA binding motif
MTYAAPNICLSVQITEAQLGYLSYLYPDEDPEEALVKLLEGDRLRALCRAERDIKVLNLDTDRDGDQPTPVPEAEATPSAESENPIGTLQEYCQNKALPMPTYDFVDVAEGFCCTVWASGLTASATASAKKKAKTVAAALLLGALAGTQVCRA